MMRIGFDISQTGAAKAGCGYYADALFDDIRRMFPDYSYTAFPYFGDFYFDSSLLLRNFISSKNLAYGPKFVSRDGAGNFWEQENLQFTISNIDILHANNYWCPIYLNTTKLIYTLYDLSFLIHPEWTTEANRLGCLNGVFRSSLVADFVVAISESSKKDYLKLFPHFPEDRIRVIYPASRFKGESLSFNGEWNLSKSSFWLSVGTIEPRKNQYLLARAYAKYVELDPSPMPLVMVGGKGWMMDDFEYYLVELGIREKVIMTGYVNDDELAWLYSNCFGNLYPSLFEGFGLPVLEGMQFGAPTIASKSSSIPEVTGGAAILIDPNDCSAWSDSMLRLSRDKSYRLSLANLSLEQSKKFSWVSSASSMVDLYIEAHETPKRIILKT